MAISWTTFNQLRRRLCIDGPGTGRREDELVPAEVRPDREDSTEQQCGTRCRHAACRIADHRVAHEEPEQPEDGHDEDGQQERVPPVRRSLGEEGGCGHGPSRGSAVS